MRGVGLLRNVGNFIFIVLVIFAFIVAVLLVLIFVMDGDAVRN